MNFRTISRKGLILDSLPHWRGSSKSYTSWCSCNIKLRIDTKHLVGSHAVSLSISSHTHPDNDVTLAVRHNFTQSHETKFGILIRTDGSKSTGNFLLASGFAGWISEKDARPCTVIRLQRPLYEDFYVNHDCKVLPGYFAASWNLFNSLLL